MNSPAGTSTTSKKRGRGSVFDAVHLLEAEDAHAERKRRTTSQRDTQRSEAAQSQTKIYSSLMECRILLQRAMQTENDNDDSKVVSDSNDDDDDDALKQSNELLTKLLEARQTLVGRQNGDDDGNNKVDYAKLLSAKDSDPALDSVLELEYESCRQNWKEVLDRRYKDARLHAGVTAKAQFRVLDSSFWQQVDSTVQHEQLQMQQSTKLFDDCKVYQQMLKDFVSASQSGDAQAAQARLRKQQKSSSLSKKNKADVDRKASKGRKIRYTEIPKLVNFTFPLSRPAKSSNLDEDEWFKSLFGGAGRTALS